MKENLGGDERTKKCLMQAANAVQFGLEIVKKFAEAERDDVIGKPITKRIYAGYAMEVEKQLKDTLDQIKTRIDDLADTTAAPQDCLLDPHP
jgi:hypothetical protein